MQHHIRPSRYYCCLKAVAAGHSAVAPHADLHQYAGSQPPPDAAIRARCPPCVRSRLSVSPALLQEGEQIRPPSQLLAYVDGVPLVPDHVLMQELCHLRWTDLQHPTRLRDREFLWPFPEFVRRREHIAFGH